MQRALTDTIPSARLVATLLSVTAIGVLLAALAPGARAEPDAPTADIDDEKEQSSMGWKDSFGRLAKASLLNIEDFADTSWRRFANRMEFSQPRQIMAYAGYGNGTHVWVQGRVLANKPIRGPKDDDSWWDNLRSTYERWETDEIAGAEVELIYGDQRRTVTTGPEGYYNARFDADTRYPKTDIVIARYTDDDASVTATHRITLAAPDAEYMIISDMDDTVIHTGITDLLLAARLTFLNNAKTRKPLAGVAGLYRELVGGGSSRNPVFYVSNSGWNMYDLLRDFIDLNDIPRGPLLLRDLGFHSDEDDTSGHKAATFRELLQRYPTLPAILIGDSGQHDAELYASVAKEFPDRILAIYIRDVDPDETSAHDAKVDAIIDDNSSTGVPMLRGRDSEMFAEHMREIGVLGGDDKEAVADSVERDKARETLAESG